MAGCARLVWTTRRMKEKLGEQVSASAARRSAQPDLYDKIADESVCTDLEPLIEHLTAVGHPALGLGEMV